MGTIRQKLHAVRAHWFQILVACAALALVFGLGMSFQAEREDAEEETQIRAALSNFNRQMKIFANDVDRMIRQAEQAQAAGEPVDDPMENLVIPAACLFSGRRPPTLRTSGPSPSPGSIETPCCM